MKFLFDFFPVVAFFIAFYIPENREQGIYLATAVAIAASFIQVTVYWFIHRRFEKMHLITLALLVILGGATLLLHDIRFIKWKPTAVNWAFALAFLGSQFIGKKTFVQRMMEQAVTVPKTVWTTLNLSWVMFFIVMGTANLYVAFNYSSEVWVNFKLFGILGLTLVFVFGQAIYMSRYISEIENEKE